MLRQPQSNAQALLRFGTIIGFMAMLRPHAFKQFTPSSITMVMYSGKCVPMPKAKQRFKTCLHNLRRAGGILGFVLDFQNKTMLRVRAYLPSLSSPEYNTNLATICPIRALIDITNRGLVKGRFCLAITKPQSLTLFAKDLWFHEPGGSLCTKDWGAEPGKYRTGLRGNSWTSWVDGSHQKRRPDISAETQELSYSWSANSIWTRTLPLINAMGGPTTQEERDGSIGATVMPYPRCEYWRDEEVQWPKMSGFIFDKSSFLGLQQSDLCNSLYSFYL